MPIHVRVILILLILLFLLSATPVRGGVGTCGVSPVRVPEGLGNVREVLASALGHSESRVRAALYRDVEARADALLERSPNDIEVRSWRMAAMGLRVDEESARGKVEIAREIHEEARWILDRDPDHPGGNHAMGRLHAGIRRMNAVVRFIARRLVGEEVFRDATWEGAEEHLRRAIASEPCSLWHRYELARVYESQGRHADAAAEVERLLAMPDSNPVDAAMRERAIALRARVAGH